MPSQGAEARSGPDLWRRLRGYARPEQAPLPAPHGDRMLYGLAQPFGAMRLLLRERDLLSSALTPVFWLAVFCAAAALLSNDEAARGRGFFREFYRTFAVLAPVPSILFAGYYARLAAGAHVRMGLGLCLPRPTRILRSATHALQQLSVVAMALAPLLLVLGWVPALGKIVVKVLGALWFLHWIVVEALDGAKVVPPDAPSEPLPVPRPWFVRVIDGAGARLPLGLGWPLRRFADLSSWLSRPWHEEIALCERHPSLLVGFALTTAAVLAVPVLNLFFRPIITVAAVGILGEIRREDDAGAP